MSNRAVVVIAVILLFVGGSVAVPGGLGAMSPQTDGPAEPRASGSAAATADTAVKRAEEPIGEQQGVTGGASLSGALGAEESHLSGSLELRTFDERLERADRPEERAAIVAAYAAESERRLRMLSDRSASLEQDGVDDTVAPGEYRYRQQSLASRSFVVERVLARSVTVAVSLPPTVQEQHGVNVSRLLVLRAEATALNGKLERSAPTAPGTSSTPSWLAGATQWNGSTGELNATNGTVDEESLDEEMIDGGTVDDAESDSLTIDGATVERENVSSALDLASGEFTNLSTVIAAAPADDQWCAAAHLSDAGDALSTAQTVAADDEALAWEALAAYTDGITAARDCLN